jgi:Glyoxalase/Bleomycin resistance protein/Dioxygenase superfamily
MAKFISEIRQMGYVVPDVEAAINYWINELGVGPWYYAPKMIASDYIYRGDTGYDPVVSVGLANLDAMQIELIQPRDDIPTLYRDFLNAGLAGVQHFAYWTEDFDADAARAKENGFSPAASGVIGPHGRFVYFEKNISDPGCHPGTVIELSEVIGPKGRFFKLIRESAAGWDGADPIRPFPDLSKF